MFREPICVLNREQEERGVQLYRESTVMRILDPPPNIVFQPRNLNPLRDYVSRILGVFPRPCMRNLSSRKWYRVAVATYGEDSDPDVCTEVSAVSFASYFPTLLFSHNGKYLILGVVRTRSPRHSRQ